MWVLDPGYCQLIWAENRDVCRLDARCLQVATHNHPSGVAEPSQADLRITQTLKNALALIEVRVLDHIIIGDVMESVSFAEQGLL